MRHVVVHASHASQVSHAIGMVLCVQAAAAALCSGSAEETATLCACVPQPSNTPTVRIGSAAVTLSGRVWRIVLTILRLPMELLSLASFKAQQVRTRARARPDQSPIRALQQSLCI